MYIHAVGGMLKCDDLCSLLSKGSEKKTTYHTHTYTFHREKEREKANVRNSESG